MGETEEKRPSSFGSEAFTLTELLLAIGILSLLVLLVLPNYFPKVEKARVSEAIAILNAIRQGETAYFYEKGEYLRLMPVPDGSAHGNAAEWTKLGLDDLNALGPPRAWSYGVEVNNTGSNPKGVDFVAVARRVNASGLWGSYNDTCIGLTGTGIYSLTSTIGSGIPSVCTTRHTFMPD